MPWKGQRTAKTPGRQLVSRQEVMDTLTLIRCQKLMQKRKTGSQVVDECMDAIRALPPVLVETATVEAEEAPVVIRLVPWYRGAATGRDVPTCKHCESEVKSRDRYCAFCGRKLCWPAKK